MFTDNGGVVHDSAINTAGTYSYTLQDDGTDGSTTLSLIVS